VNSTRAQIELHPYCTREDVQAYCKEHGIVLEAYSPLTKGLKLKEPVLVAIAKQYGVTTAQVLTELIVPSMTRHDNLAQVTDCACTWLVVQLLLRWALQRGAVILPKSVNADRIKQNADVFGFHISDKHMSELNALNANLATGW
jgi:diketogulonate reductase-like aldo/keto reductase